METELFIFNQIGEIETIILVKQSDIMLSRIRWLRVGLTDKIHVG